MSQHKDRCHREIFFRHAGRDTRYEYSLSYIESIADITERKRAETAMALSCSRDAAAAVARLKDFFTG